MKNLIIIILLGMVVSCSSSMEPDYGGDVVMTTNYTYYSVDYIGSWSGDIISNGGIYPVSGIGDVIITGIDGIAINKLDITLQIISLNKIYVREYNDGYKENHINTVKTTSNNVIRIE